MQIERVQMAMRKITPVTGKMREIFISPDIPDVTQKEISALFDATKRRKNPIVLLDRLTIEKGVGTLRETIFGGIVECFRSDKERKLAKNASFVWEGYTAKVEADGSYTPQKQLRIFA